MKKSNGINKEPMLVIYKFNIGEMVYVKDSGEKGIIESRGVWDNEIVYVLDWQHSPPFIESKLSSVSEYLEKNDDIVKIRRKTLIALVLTGSGIIRNPKKDRIEHWKKIVGALDKEVMGLTFPKEDKT